VSAGRACRYDADVPVLNELSEGANPTHARDPESPRPRDRLAGVTLFVACLGCVAFPLGCVLLAWSGLVSLVMVGGAIRDGRRVSRLAVAALVVTVAGPIVLLWLLPKLPTS
jgi:hypothetical protein